MKIMLNSKPSSWRNCLTCEFWAGPRKPSTFGETIGYNSDLDKGVCLERGWHKSQKIAMSTCSKWLKWDSVANQPAGEQVGRKRSPTPTRRPTRSERRLFPRIYKSLRFEYQAQLQGSEDYFSNRAVMNNISMSGLHFMSKTAPVLKLDDIADFVFKFQPNHANPLIPRELKTTGKVKRLEQPTKESRDFGVALEFLSGPVFIYAD